MEALTIFKQAGLEELLNSVKNEWDNGHFLKPMAIGAGAGGLGFGGSALLENKKDETGGAKAKRVLSQLLKGTALGAGAGGAYGGLSYAFGGNKETPKETPNEPSKDTSIGSSKFSIGDQKASTSTPKTEGSPQNLTRWEQFGETNRNNPLSPAYNTFAGAAAGGAGGATLGAGGGLIADKMNVAKPSPAHNPLYTAGKTVAEYTKPDGLLSKALQEASSEASKGRLTSILDASGAQSTMGGRQANIGDVISKLNPTTLQEGPTGEILGQLKRMMAADPSKFSNPSSDALLNAASRFGHSVDLSAVPNKDFLKALQSGIDSTSHSTLPSVQTMNALEQAASRSHLHRGVLGGLKGGGILGALGGATANILSQNAFPQAPLNIPNGNAGTVSPDSFK